MVSADLALLYEATGNCTNLGDFVHFPHFYLTRDLFHFSWLQHAFHRSLDLLNGFVNDGVHLDLHTFLLGEFPCSQRRPHLEADDDGVGCRGEHNITVYDLTYGFVDHIHLDLFHR